jgi:hypothetical protein
LFKQFELICVIVPYSGRFFYAPTNPRAINAALEQWEAQKGADLAPFWPSSEIPFGHMTHQRNPLPRHGITRWADFFNPRQLLVHATLLKAIIEDHRSTKATTDFVLGAFQQYLRNNCVYCIWDKDYDKLVPHLSNNNFNPKCPSGDFLIHHFDSMDAFLILDSRGASSVDGQEPGEVQPRSLEISERPDR